jgi:hypothetical protein
MAEKVKKIGVKREFGYLYFLDKQGDISRSLMARGGKKNIAKVGKKSLKVEKIGLKKEKGFFYFIDKQGDISRSLMARGGSLKKSIKI